MRLLPYDMLINVNGIYYVHACEQARWARSAGNSAIENVCIYVCVYVCIIIIRWHIQFSIIFVHLKVSFLNNVWTNAIVV